MALLGMVLGPWTVVLASEPVQILEGTLSRARALEVMQKQSALWRKAEIMKIEARAKSEEARSPLSPQLSLVSRQYVTKYSGLRFGLSDVFPTDFVHVGSSNLEVLYLIYDSAARERGQAAEENQKMTEFQIQRFQRDLAGQLLRQYASLRRAGEKTKNAQASVNRAELFQSIARARKNVGVGTQLDTVRAEALVASEQLKWVLAQTSFLQAKQELSNLMGARLSNLILEAHVPEVMKGKMLDPDQVSAERPDVRMAQHLVGALQHMRNAAKRDGFPKVAIAGDVGFVGSQTFLGFGPGTLNASAGLQVSVPLYTGGRIMGKESEEEARLLQAELQLQQIELESRNLALLTNEQLESSEISLHTAERALKAAEEEVKVMQKRFQAGTASAVDVANASLALANASDHLTDARFSIEQAHIQYCYLAGTWDLLVTSGQGEKRP